MGSINSLQLTYLNSPNGSFLRTTWRIMPLQPTFTNSPTLLRESGFLANLWSVFFRTRTPVQTKTYDQVLKSTQKWDTDVKQSVLSGMLSGAQKSTFGDFSGVWWSEKFSFSPPFECMSWSYLALNQAYIVHVFTRRKATISSVYYFDVFVSDSRTHYEAFFLFPLQKDKSKSIIKYRWKRF